MRTDVVALYVDRIGVYPYLVADWYDEARGAVTYWGDLPVVAHPPCGPWGRLRHLSKKDSPVHGLFAVDTVRRVGGVLEHPAGSLLWKACGMPKPGERPDWWGGTTIEVNQVDFGHVARKRTWIYMVGVRRKVKLPPAREPTHWISGGRGREGKKSKTTPVPDGIKVCSAEQRRRTPRAFAEWLLDLAASVRRT